MSGDMKAKHAPRHWGTTGSRAAARTAEVCAGASQKSLRTQGLGSPPLGFGRVGFGQIFPGVPMPFPEVKCEAESRWAPLLDGLMPQAETAAELDTTIRTLNRWHERRIGPPRIAIGKKIFYRREAVRAWLLRCESESFDEPPYGRRQPGRPRKDPAKSNGKKP
jgi:hypothetical protein